MQLIGIDLGVRSVHVSTDTYCTTFAAPIKKWPRYQEIQYLCDMVSEQFSGDYYAYVEEPVVAGARNLRVSLRIAQVGGAVLSVVNGEFVPVSTWKKATVGKGNAPKSDVKKWLEGRPEYIMASSSQDWVDATCIRLYGEMCAKR